MEDKATDSGILDSIGRHDILIAVVGDVGVGKSTFINKAAAEDILPIDQASKPDDEPQNVICSKPDLFQGQKVVFLDIPAFDSEFDEQVIRSKFRYWLRVVISKRLKIPGILYLHRATNAEFSSTSLRHLTLLMALCKELDQGPSAVLLVLTMQTLLPLSVRLQRRKELQDRWYTIFSRGVSQTTRFENSSDSAWEIVMDLTTHLEELTERSGHLGSTVSKTNTSADNYTQPTAARPRPLTSMTDTPASSVNQRPNDTIPSIGPRHNSSPGEHLNGSSRAYDRSRILIAEIARSPLKRAHVIDLVGDEAQCMVDFLDVVLEEKSVLRTDEGAHIFSVLSKLAKAAQVFPRRYHLPGVVCDLTYPWKQGGFGDIYKGFCGNQEVCVKVVRVYQRQDNQTKLREHVKELILWAHLLHPNIIPLCGVYLSGERPPRICIVSPWVKHGDLSKYVNDFPERSRMPLLSDVIAGLGYLHESKITHADLKAANILVSINERAMITDFGISQSESVTTTLISNGTANWMAPELFLQADARPTQESDIWSFGCLCYEVLTRKIPFSDQYETVARLIRAFIDGHAIPSRPPDNGYDRVDEGMWNLMVQCLDNRTDARPKCKDIQRSLAKMNIKDSRTQLYGDLSGERKAHPSVEIDYQRLEMILIRCNAKSSSLDTAGPTPSNLPNSPSSLTTHSAGSFSGGQSTKRGDRNMCGALVSGAAGSISATVPGSANLTKMTSTRTSGTSAKMANSSSKDKKTPEEAVLVRRFGKELKEIEEFVKEFAKGIVEWARMSVNVVRSLRIWALGFAKAIGLSADQGSGSEAFDAFLVIVEHELIPLCIDLETVINERVVKELAHLLMTMTQPLKLLASMNEQELHHRRLMGMNVSAKNRPSPALLAASTDYLALRSQLAAELPTYISLLRRGLKVSIYKLSRLQLDFYARVRDEWVCLWEMLRLEEELDVRAEETADVWFARWGEVDEVVASIALLQAWGCEHEQEKERESESQLEAPGTDTEFHTYDRLQAVAHCSPPIPDHNHTCNQPSQSLPCSHGYNPSSPSSLSFMDPPNSANSLATSFTDSLYDGQSMEHRKWGGYSGHSTYSTRSQGVKRGRAKDKDSSSQTRSGSIRSSRDSRNCSPTHGRIPSRADSIHSTYSTKSQSGNRGRAKDKDSSSRKRSGSITSITSFFTGSSRGSRDHSPTHTRVHIPSKTSSAQTTYSNKSRDDSKRKRKKNKDPSPHKRSLSIQSITSLFTFNKSGRNTSPTTHENTHMPSHPGDWTLEPSKYTCQVVHPCKIPTIGSKAPSYFSFPLFTLKEGEYYDVLQEAGHPSLHPNLPLIVDEGEDCLLLCRARDGSIGWALASFLEPVGGVEE